MNRLNEREEQAKGATREERESGATSNPIIGAEDNPNRFESLTFFFPEDDGVKIERDIDLDEVTVEYFFEGGSEILTEGALYEWALERWEED